MVPGGAIVIGSKRGILEKLSHAKAKMGGGSSLCETPQLHDGIKDMTTWAR